MTSTSSLQSPASFVLRVTGLELLLLAVLAAAIGAALGFTAQEGLAWLLR